MRYARIFQLSIGIGVAVVVFGFIVWEVMRHKKKKQLRELILAAKKDNSQHSDGSENPGEPSLGVDSGSSAKAEAKSL